MSSWGARVVLAALAFAIVGGIASSDPQAWTDVFDESRGGDAAFFERIAERVRDGEDYYAAAFDEAEKSNYPTHSVFNFRFPAVLWMLAIGETATTARILLGSLATLTWVVWVGFWTGREKSVASAALGGVLLLGAAIPSFTSRGVFFAEQWSGVLIASSLVARLYGRWLLAVVAGLAALLVRALALP